MSEIYLDSCSQMIAISGADVKDSFQAELWNEREGRAHSKAPLGMSL